MKQTIHYKLESWVAKTLNTTTITLHPLSSDASFRRYYRVLHHNQTHLIMEAPPQQENLFAFVKISEHLLAAGLPVPRILAYDLLQGFAIISDFGDTVLQTVLHKNNVDYYYRQAIDHLLVFSKICAPRTYALPYFSPQYILKECNYFQEWFLQKLLNISPSSLDGAMLQLVYNLFIDNSLTQPQVIVHKDYHSRNLMVLNSNTLGLIDFQDAIIGPITYDIASLLKDCYVTWPKKTTQQSLSYYYKALNKQNILTNCTLTTFQQWFHLSGLQRHIKVLGIFSRLYLRDNKARYLSDMPRIIRYILPITRSNPILLPFNHFLQKTIIPRLKIFWHKHAIKDSGFSA